VHELVLKMCDSNMHGDRIKINYRICVFVVVYTWRPCIDACDILESSCLCTVK
jgi:hypothetical protein